MFVLAVVLQWDQALRGHLDDMKKVPTDVPEFIPEFVPEFVPEYKSEFGSNSVTNSGTNSGMKSGTYLFYVVLMASLVAVGGH